MKQKITKKQFQDYVRVQNSGLTNMFDIANVEMMSGLEKNQIMFIMKNYKELEKEFLEKTVDKSLYFPNL